MMNTEEIKKQQELQQQIIQIEDTAKKFMTREAIERYSNIKIANASKALQIVILINELASSGNLKEKITDDQLKQILIQTEPKKRQTRIIRK